MERRGHLLGADRIFETTHISRFIIRWTASVKVTGLLACSTEKLMRGNFSQSAVTFGNDKGYRALERHFEPGLT